MISSQLCTLLLLVNTFSISVAIGFAVYKDKATRLVEEGIVSPHRNGPDEAERSFRSAIPQPDRLPGYLGDILVKIFEERILMVAELCKDDDTKAEVLQKLVSDNTTYQCILGVINEGVPLQHRASDVYTTDLVKALCLHPRKCEDCYEAGLGPVVRQCLSDGATQGHESLMFLWEKTGNAICHALFDDSQQVPQNSVIAKCLRSKGLQMAGCFAAFVGGNKDLPRLTPDTAQETAPHRCRNMVDLMRCSVGVLEGCNDSNLTSFATTVFHKSFEYTTCNTTKSAADMPGYPNFLASEHRSESSPINIMGEVMRVIGQLDYSEVEAGTLFKDIESNSTVVQPTESSLLDFEEKIFIDSYPSTDGVLNNETIPTEMDAYSTEGQLIAKNILWGESLLNSSKVMLNYLLKGKANSIAVGSSSDVLDIIEDETNPPAEGSSSDVLDIIEDETNPPAEGSSSDVLDIIEDETNPPAEGSSSDVHDIIEGETNPPAEGSSSDVHDIIEDETNPPAEGSSSDVHDTVEGETKSPAEGSSSDVHDTVEGETKSPAEGSSSDVHDTVEGETKSPAEGSSSDVHDTVEGETKSPAEGSSSDVHVIEGEGSK